MLRMILSVSAVALIALGIAFTLRSTTQAELASGEQACACGQCDVGCSCCSDESVSCDDCECLVCACDSCADHQASGDDKVASCCAHLDATSVASSTESTPDSTCCAGCESGCGCCVDGTASGENCNCSYCECEFCDLETETSS